MLEMVFALPVAVVVALAGFWTTGLALGTGTDKYSPANVITMFAVTVVSVAAAEIALLSAAWHLWALATLGVLGTGLLTVAVRRRWPLTGLSMPRWRPIKVAVLWVAAAGCVLVTVVGAIIHSGSSYGVHFGKPAALQWLSDCETTVTIDTHFGDSHSDTSCQAEWIDSGATVFGTLYISPSALDDVRSSRAGSVVVHAVGDDAYFPAGVATGAVDVLGLPYVWWASGVAAVGLAVLARRRARKRKPRRGAPMTIVGERVEFSADPTGFVVRTRQAAGGWAVHLRLTWAEVRSMMFRDDPYDPIVKLFVMTVAGQRRFVMDARDFAEQQWRQVADAVAALTGDRVTLDIARRSG